MNELDLTPEIEIQSTISNPMSPAEVIGFHGRNKTVGESIVVIKEAFVRDGKVLVPSEDAKDLTRGNSQLAVLEDGTLLLMSGHSFAKQSSWTMREIDDVRHKFNFAHRSNDEFEQYDRKQIEIHN